LPPERPQKFTGFDATIGMLQWKGSMQFNFMPGKHFFDDSLSHHSAVA